MPFPHLISHCFTIIHCSCRSSYTLPISPLHLNQVVSSLERGLTISSWHTTIATALSAPGAEIDSQLSSINLLSNQCLLPLDGTLNIHEIRVGESSRLASTSIDSNTDIDDISDVTEELVEISIRHLESEVADEEGLGGWVGGIFTAGCVHVVDDEAAAFEHGLVLGFDGLGSLFDGFEFDVSESLAQTSSISGKSNLLNSTKLSKLLLQIRSRDIEKQVPNIHTTRRCGRRTRLKRSSTATLHAASSSATVCSTTISVCPTVSSVSTTITSISAITATISASSSAVPSIPTASAESTSSTSISITTIPTSTILILSWLAGSVSLRLTSRRGCRIGGSVDSSIHSTVLAVRSWDSLRALRGIVAVFSECRGDD